MYQLTGNPLQTETVIGVLPMCAPWDCLQTFKFRIKLTPGSIKRGKGSVMSYWLLIVIKAAGLVLQALLQTPDITPLEKQLISKIPGEELVQCMMGEVKIAGGQALQKQGGNKKKT